MLLTIGSQALYERRPFCAKFICSSKTTVTTDDYEGVDPLLDEIQGGPGPALYGSETRAACSTDDCTALNYRVRINKNNVFSIETHLTHPASDVVPSDSNDVSTFETLFARSINRVALSIA